MGEEMKRRERIRGAQTLNVLLTVMACLLPVAEPCVTQEKGTQPGDTRTQVVLLGTGNPFPDPDRSGPATAIVVNSTAT
jgi:hypothetical protein